MAKGARTTNCPPAREEKAYEEPFLSSDEESAGSVCSPMEDDTRAPGPCDDDHFNVVSSDDELPVDNCPDDEGCADEGPSGVNREISSGDETEIETADKAENGTDAETVHRKPLPVVPQAASIPCSSKESGTEESPDNDPVENRMKVSVELCSNERIRNRWFSFPKAAETGARMFTRDVFGFQRKTPPDSSDEIWSEVLPSDLESVSGDESSSTDKSGSIINFPPSKRRKRFLVCSGDSESDNESSKENNDPSATRKSGKKVVQVSGEGPCRLSVCECPETWGKTETQRRLALSFFLVRSRPRRPWRQRRMRLVSYPARTKTPYILCRDP